MDEILHQPRAGAAGAEEKEGAASPYRQRTALERKVEGLMQRHSGLVRRWDRFTAKLEHFNPMAFLAAATVVGIAAVVGTVYTPCYQVSVDGETLGVVATQEEFEGAIQRVEQRASDILGYTYTMDGEVTYELALAKKQAVPSAASYEPYLLDRIGEVMKSYVLSVNGKVIGAAENKSTLDAILEDVQSAYVTENTVETGFVDQVSISREYIASTVEQDAANIEAALTANTNGQTTYTVVSGDTFSDIANNNGMTMAELEALNPGVDIQMLMIGQELNVKEEIPTLSVRTVDAVTYTEAIPYETQQVEDSSMYEGESKVIQAGVNGRQQVNANITYINGKESSRDITGTTTLSEPTEAIVAVGTKEKPTWVATGSFRWPVYGRITSSYGYRSIFGSYSLHRGIDIACSYGTGIVAADGGTVTFSGWNGTYGKLVVIDHGNGKVTYYAHNSSLLVSVGDKVAKGETIALAGSTGRSTGTHCHFEVHVNGQLVNPLNYLP